MVKSKKVIKEKGKEIEKTNKVPIGVKTIAIWCYALIVVCVLFGLYMIVYASELSAAFIEMQVTLSSTSFILGGIILIGMAVLNFFLGKALWKLKAWARIVSIFLAVLGLLYLAYYILLGGFGFVSLVFLVINVAIAVYLVFDKEAKKIFK